MVNNKKVTVELNINDKGFNFNSDIATAKEAADIELDNIVLQLSENSKTIKALTPECDKLDYILAVSCGAICGVIDVFLVGKPGESPIGNITDKWFADRTMDFAKLCGWDGEKNSSLQSAMHYLEKKFKIPYDQRGAGDAASWIFDLNPKNHHFKSLGHNPSLLGLFFSILDQFLNVSHFVSGGELIALEEADDKFELFGKNVPSKLFCGFINWFGHLVSDLSGSSCNMGRGMGIPSPFWTWTNDIIAIKKEIHIPVAEFDKQINDLALQIYKEGYDARFQTAQAIPVFINELMVRTMYSVRRLMTYFSKVKREDRIFSDIWKSCEPFSNATVKRMLSVSHGTFVLLNSGDAVVRGFISGGGYFNVAEFAMRLNIVGVGRFSISLYGEACRGVKLLQTKENSYFLLREKVVVEDYIEGLRTLSVVYDDKELVSFADDFKAGELYKQGFSKTILLAEKRNVPAEKIIRTKADIDSRFT